MIERFKNFFVREYVELKDTPFYWADVPPGSCEYQDGKGVYVIFDDNKVPKCCKQQLYSAHINHSYNKYDSFHVDFRTTIFGKTFWSVFRDYWYGEHAGYKGISSPFPDGYNLESLIKIIPMNSKEIEDGFKKIDTSPLSSYVINIIRSEMPVYGYDDDFFYYADRRDRRNGESLLQTLERSLDYKREARKK